ncbi:MAG: thioesterase family protein [Clostridia bacterium]|nr:thioesterase family protein [Clostridia bacterium]
MLNSGLTNRCEVKVDETNTAAAVGSGDLQVFSTPMMIALMEETCATCVAAHLDEGMTTVGTKVDIVHSAATPLGMNVYCDCVLEGVEGRKLVFSVKAFDERGLIGEGNHERFIVNAEKFQLKTDSK